MAWFLELGASGIAVRTWAEARKLKEFGRSSPEKLLLASPKRRASLTT